MIKRQLKQSMGYFIQCLRLVNAQKDVRDVKLKKIQKFANDLAVKRLSVQLHDRASRAKMCLNTFKAIAVSKRIS